MKNHGYKVKIVEVNYNGDGEKFDKPKNLQTMVNLAERLSKNFPFVRVDFYNINGVIYFGELTFYPSSGYTRFIPDDADFELGKLFTYSFNQKS